MSNDDVTKKLTEDFAERLREWSSPIYALQKQMQELVSEVQSLNQKVDARLHDTRPIWESVQQQLKDISVNMEKGFHNIHRRIDVVSADINKLRTDISLLDERIDKLEKEPV